MSSASNKYDAVVVGSGPGGASVARDLSQNGKKVLILEWGDHAPVRGTLLQAFPQYYTPGRSLFVTGQLLGLMRGVTTGGSSIFYCATAFDPPVSLLKSYGVDISTEVQEVRDEVPVSTLSDELMSPAGTLFLESALDLGYDAKKLNKFIFQDKCRKDCDRCSFGCPHGAKWTARNFVEDALANGAEMIKVRDGLGGRITDSGWVWKSLKESDKHKLQSGRKHARRILKNMGARDIYNSWLFASHPGGTVKIGEHLDNQLQTRIKNLYVCDCSVIPEELGLPPTLTLLSLGRRLAKHLLSQ